MLRLRQPSGRVARRWSTKGPNWWRLRSHSTHDGADLMAAALIGDAGPGRSGGGRDRTRCMTWCRGGGDFGCSTSRARGWRRGCMLDVGPGFILLLYFLFYYLCFKSFNPNHCLKSYRPNLYTNLRVGVNEIFSIVYGLYLRKNYVNLNLLCDSCYIEICRWATIEMQTYGGHHN
jgi:hypothetical protein